MTGLESSSSSSSFPRNLASDILFLPDGGSFRLVLAISSLDVDVDWWSLPVVGMPFDGNFGFCRAGKRRYTSEIETSLLMLTSSFSKATEDSSSSAGTFG